MARFGRGQPHAPIFLRAPLIAAVLAVAAPQIHVVLAKRAPPSARIASVTQLRNALVPAAAPEFVRPKLIVITDPGRRQKGRVVQVRNSAAELEYDDRGPGQQIIQWSGRERSRARADVVFTRNPVVVPAVAAPPAVRIHVVTPYRLKRPSVRLARLRAPDLPSAFIAPAVRIHVVEPYRLKRPTAHATTLRAPTIPIVFTAPVVRIRVVQAERPPRARRPDGSAVYVHPRAPVVSSIVPADAGSGPYDVTVTGGPGMRLGSGGGGVSLVGGPGVSVSGGGDVRVH